MGLDLPAELIEVIGLLGLSWPETDESKVLDQGSAWSTLGNAAAVHHQQAIDAVVEMCDTNSGVGISAFLAAWEKIAVEDSALRDHQLVAQSQAVASYTAGGLVLQAKTLILRELAAAAVIVELAVIAAPGTAGASVVEAAQLLVVIHQTVLAIFALTIELIRWQATFQARLAVELQGKTAQLAGRPIHTGSDSTTSNSGDLSQRLQQAETVVKSPGQRRAGFPPQGVPNSVVKRTKPDTGRITAYVEYDVNGYLKKRVDLDPSSAPHHDKTSGLTIPPPHTHEYVVHQGRGHARVQQSITRPADPEEVP